ncbi:MAG: thioesterase family protein [Pedobacter sp.]
MSLRVLFGSRTAGFIEPFRRSFRVLPTDCDMNLHLTNSRYFSLLDIVRVEHLAVMKLIRPLLKRGWMPVLNATEMTFIRPIAPLRKFDVVINIVTWDEKYLYMEQRFESPGTLHAVSMARAAFVCEGEVVHPDRIAALAGYSGNAPSRSDIVGSWQTFFSDKKQHFSAKKPDKQVVNLYP